MPSDLLGGVLLGITAGAAVLVAFGSPAGKPTVDEVQRSLTDLGYDVAAIHRRGEDSPRLGDGRDADLGRAATESTRSAATSATRSSPPRPGTGPMYKEPGLPVFGSRIQQVEHVGYTLMLADRAGVHRRGS